MAPRIPLKVALYENPGILHWSLFIDTPEDAEKTVIHILGARQRYFPNVRTLYDANESKSLVEMCNLCEIDAADIETVKSIGWNTHIRNDEADYSCQDFILDVLEKLERENIIDKDNADYMGNKAAVQAKRESWP